VTSDAPPADTTPPRRGRLAVCATPIGNLADASPRLAATLAASSLVACEDTRRTRVLLSALGVNAPRLVRLDAHAGAVQVARIVEDLLAGADVSLVTDAGTPTVSDPGRLLVRAAQAAGVEVVAVPGPSAAVTALAVSGVAADQFLFVGFLPRSASALRHLLARIDTAGVALVGFESPGRVAATLATIAAQSPTREVAVCRELTKHHEQVVRADAASVAERFASPTRGEVTLVIGAEPPTVPAVDADAIDATLALLRNAGVSTRDASSLVARLTGESRRAVYERARSHP
jgi:16S rRNA (cytidine1402-2'-O)-methyltransferase